VYETLIESGLRIEEEKGENSFLIRNYVYIRKNTSDWTQKNIKKN
jgi:hypothetical protein